MNKNYFAFGLPIRLVKTVRLLLILFFLISISSYSQVTKTFTSPGTGNLEVPAGVTNLSVQTWGAGGGGGGSNNTLSAAGGGGGGAFKQATVIVGTDKDNVKVSYTVGAGGSGGASTSINGSAGGVSVFSTISANGGGGGIGGTSLIQYGAGGAGGAAGDYKGGNGATAYLLGASIFPLVIEANISGGGGSSAGTVANGNNASGKNGAAAVSGGGSGGAGNSQNIIDLLLSPNNPGTSGGSPGGGGGGALGVGVVNGVVGGLINGNIAASTGGNGGNGQIKVTYTCPTYSVSSITADVNCAQTLAITLHSTPEGLPIGTYTVTYNRSVPFATGLTATLVVETPGTGLPFDVAGLPVSGLSTITITNLTSVDCSSTVNTAIIFDRPVKPTVASVAHPSCEVPSGSVDFSGLLVGGTIHQTGVSSASYPIITATQTVTGLESGSFNFVVSNGNCSSATVSEVVSISINNPPPTRTWNGLAWDAIPTMENKVIFAASYNEDAANLDENVDIEACSCEVNSGVHVTIKTGRYLKIRNELEVDPLGSLTFENDASLVQINDDAINSGKITYKRHTKLVKRYDFTYWSSPVEGQMLKNVSPNTLYDKYYSFSPTNGWVIHYNGNKLMIPGEGYIIRAPQTFSITAAAIDFNPKFEGMPNNGVIDDLELGPNKVYLLGNPYPSAIDADAFLTENAAKLQGTLYFWTHNSPPSIDVDGDAIYNYTTNDYATYNLTGGVATHAVVDSDLNDPNDNNNLDLPTGKIAAAQGFFAPSSETGGIIVFNNQMRLLDEEIIDNSQFFKLTNKTKSATRLEKNRVWLNLSNAQGAFKQTLIGYISGATNDYEGSFDGVTYDGNQFVDFYSVNQGTNLSIQGRALPFHNKDSVSLGYKSAVVGEFKISIDHTDGELASQTLFLEDKQTQLLHDLTQSAYTFNTEKGVFNDRFVLRYVDKNAVEEFPETLNKEVLVSVHQGVITINSPEELLEKVILYDTVGRKIYQKDNIGANVLSVQHLVPNHQLLIVAISLSNKSKFNQKIVY